MAQLRQRVMQDPNYLVQVLQSIAAVNPALAQQLAQNPQALLAMIFGGAGGMRGMPGARPRRGIQVTPEEKASIERVLFVILYKE